MNVLPPGIPCASRQPATEGALVLMVQTRDPSIISMFQALGGKWVEGPYYSLKEISQKTTILYFHLANIPLAKIESRGHT